MNNPFQMMREEMVKRSQSKALFDRSDDAEFARGVVGIILSLPSERLRRLIESKSESLSLKDRFEARELALILFVHEELRKLPQSVSAADGVEILLDTLREAVEQRPRP